MSLLPTTIYTRLVNKVTAIFKEYGMHHSNQELILRRDADLIASGIEEVIRECISREILAWHDLECNKLGIDCTCRDISMLVAGKELGDEIEI
jgi:hypothetical protein